MKQKTGAERSPIVEVEDCVCMATTIRRAELRQRTERCKAHSRAETGEGVDPVNPLLVSVG
jgi:hypothetical protein